MTASREWRLLRVLPACALRLSLRLHLAFDRIASPAFALDFELRLLSHIFASASLPCGTFG
jgi:hypothetical protein